MKKFLAVLLMAVLLCAVPISALAAGTCVLTKSDSVEGQDIVIYTYTCTADAAAATYPVTNTYPIDGWIIRVETNPGNAVAPTALYDITLVDSDGVDVMGAALMNRSATLSEHVLAPQPYVRGSVSITITNNAVNSAVVVLAITVLR